MRLVHAGRLLAVLAHLMRGLAICTLVFPWMGPERRLASVGRWSAQLLRIFRVSVELAPGSARATHGLWVANHVSWMDVFVINAMFPARFVAKSEVRRWPLVGILSARAGTMFVTRAQRRGLRDTVATLAAALEGGERVVVFPEGTSAAQGAMQPFRANLFEAAVAARVAVQPVAIRYLDPDGHFHSGVEYIGDMSLVESIMALVSGKPIRAQLATMTALPACGGHRRELARHAHDAIRDYLGACNCKAARQAHDERVRPFVREH
jgi:1-acyl-sn-glycerol-3-phosphate acyltransferase